MRCVPSLVLLSFALAGCQSTVTATGGVDVPDVELNAFFHQITEPLAGEDSPTITRLDVVVTDRDCAGLGSGDTAGFAAQITALTLGEASDVQANASQAKLLDDAQDGDVFLGGLMAQASGDGSGALYGSLALYNPDATPTGSLFINQRSVSAGTTTSLSGEATVTLDGDFSDDATRDTDWTGDGDPDYAAIDSELTVSFVGAEPCDGLDF